MSNFETMSCSHMYIRIKTGIRIKTSVKATTTWMTAAFMHLFFSWNGRPVNMVKFRHNLDCLVRSSML